MRDRLIELLDNASAEIIECYPDGTPCMSYNKKAVDRRVVYQLANHLIANGVIVLPCKIGDTLYDISEYLDGTSHPEMYELRDIDMMVEKIDDNTYVFSYDGWCMNHDDIGKSLFFTKEEAEKALKECKGK